MRKKYNPDNIFKNNPKTKEEEKIITKEPAIIEHKESIFKKFINKIKNLLHI